MEINISDFEDYKKFLKSWLECQPNKGYGWKAKLSSAARCNAAYLSQVLGGAAHLNLEQADSIGQRMSLSDAEHNYFLLMVHLARAGTPSLRKIFLNQLQSARQEFNHLGKRLKFESQIDELQKINYYSDWAPSAIHVSLFNPKLQRIPDIASYFGLSSKIVRSTLDSLVRGGFAEKRGDRYFAGSVNVHLADGSLFVSQHHRNWRLKALQEIRNTNEGLHFSSTITINPEAVGKAREILTQAIEKIRKVVRESTGEEETYAYGIDFFGLRKSD